MHVRFEITQSVDMRKSTYVRGCGWEGVARSANASPRTPTPLPAFWVNYFKIMQFSTRNRIYTPNFGPKTKIFLRFSPHSAKYLKFTPRFLKVSLRACVYAVKLEMYCFFFSVHGLLLFILYVNNLPEH